MENNRISDAEFQKRLEILFPPITRKTPPLPRIMLTLFWTFISVAFGYFWCWEALTS